MGEHGVFCMVNEKPWEAPLPKIGGVHPNNPFDYMAQSMSDSFLGTWDTFSHPPKATQGDR